jgi:hypothetical protein
MREPSFDGALCRDQGLPDHLPAEHALPADLRAQATKQVDLERFEIENRKELFQRAAHGRNP